MNNGGAATVSVEDDLVHEADDPAVFLARVALLGVGFELHAVGRGELLQDGRELGGRVALALRLRQVRGDVPLELTGRDQHVVDAALGLEPQHVERVQGQRVGDGDRERLGVDVDGQDAVLLDELHRHFAERLRVERAGVEIDEGHPELVRQGPREGLFGQQAEIDQDFTQALALALLLLGQRRVDVRLGDQPGLDEHLPDAQLAPLLLLGSARDVVRCDLAMLDQDLPDRHGLQRALRGERLRQGRGSRRPSRTSSSPIGSSFSRATTPWW